MRRRGGSVLVSLILLGGLFATASLAANFAHRSDLSAWALGRFSPPGGADPPAEGGPAPSLGADADGRIDGAAEPPWPERSALRFDHVDVRGPWPLSAFLQNELEGLPPVIGLSLVLGIDRSPTDGTFRAVGGVAEQTKLPSGALAYALWSHPIVLGAVGKPTDCFASGIPGAERCLGLEAPEARGLRAIFLDGPAHRKYRLALDARAIVAMGHDPVDRRGFHRVRVEAWLPEAELANLPESAQEAARRAMLAAPDRDTDGDGVGDAYTFHLEAWGEPIDLLSAPEGFELGWR
jgi:hypothetical protein